MDLIIGCETDNDNSYTVNGSKYSVKYDIRYSEKVKEEYTRLSVGGIAGENKGTIVNCRVVNVYIYSELSDTDNDGNAYLNLGGIAGVNFGDIINSMVNDSYTGGYMPVASDSGDNNIGHLGGITALNANKIEFCLVEDCTFLLDVRGDGCPVFLGKNMAYPQATVGGIVADQDSSIDLSKCISYNNAIGIHCSKGDYTEPTVKVGTIVGALTTAQITSCYAIYPTDATPITTTLGNGDPKYTNSILGEGESEGCIAISDKNELSDDMKYLLSDETDNGLNYFLKSDGTYEVIRIPYDQGSNYELVIPSTFNEIPVTSIGSSAFLWCTSLTSITIPSSVTSISSSAFLWCTSLTTVTFEQGSQLISIGDDAFSNCYSLTSITIPSSVTSIGTGAFSNCYSLTNITIPDSVTSIGNSAFDCCTSLVSVTLSEDSRLTSIGSDAFSNCYSLTNITIPSSVTSIGTGAFYACYNLTTVVFERDSQLESIVWAAFGECTNLTSITIPNSVTSIGSSAFYGCNDLTNITIPSSVTSIGSSAFSSCDALTSVIFEGDSKLESIGSSAFSSCDALTSITIHSSVTSIDSWAFSSCDALTSITIPSSVTSIGDCVFLFSDNLTSVYYTGTEEQWNNISIGDDNEYLTNATITYNYKSESN
ncbi:MAG: leucine-rich repeat domain-containing protein [Clostridia bacterium]|nr:leucine-rich repeat domain-containing protein [Clostridia bacterium]